MVTMNQLLAEKKDEIDKFYEEDKEEGDLDGRRGSFKEFYGHLKLMEKTGGDERQSVVPMSTDGYVTGTITHFNKTLYNEENDIQYTLTDQVGMSMDPAISQALKSPTGESNSKSAFKLNLRDSFTGNTTQNKKAIRPRSPRDIEDRKKGNQNLHSSTPYIKLGRATNV